MESNFSYHIPFPFPETDWGTKISKWKRELGSISIVFLSIMIYLPLFDNIATAEVKMMKREITFFKKKYFINFLFLFVDLLHSVE